MTVAVVVAGGPSITIEQEEMVKAAHARRECRLLVVNNMWERFPSADVLYATDRRWWDKYIEPVRQGFRGDCWTRDAEASKQYDLCFIQSRRAPGLSRDPGVIHEGSNGGYQLTNLARHFLVRDPAPHHIVLVAFDMMRGPNNEAHSYGDHPKGWGNASDPAKQWAPYFDELCRDLMADGIRVTNCSLRTALRVAPRADLAETLERL